MGRRWYLYTVIDSAHLEIKYTLTVALTTYKVMGLRRNFDEKMKDNSKLLSTEATFGFC